MATKRTHNGAKPENAEAKSKKLPTVHITHYTGSVAIVVSKAYPEGVISEELRSAVNTVLEKHT